MKNSEMMMVAAAGALLLWALKSRAMGINGAPPKDYATAITNTAQPGTPAYGWQYFTGGTVIDPDGAYWRDGRIVWAPGLDASW